MVWQCRTSFFHVRKGGDLILDPEGSALPNIEAARKEALIGLRQVIADRLRGSRISDVRQIEISSEAGQTLATVSFEEALKSLDQ